MIQVSSILRPIFEYVRKKNVLNSLIPGVVFLCIAFSIIPFWPPGYFFLLDDPIFYSRLAGDIKNIFDFSIYPISLVLRWASTFLDFWMIQRVVFFWSLFSLGLAAYYNLARFNKAAGYFAGLFAIWNPFVFARIGEGQVNVLWGIAMAFWTLYFLSVWYESLHISKIFLAWAACSIAIMWTPHAIFLVWIPATIILLAKAIQEKKVMIFIKNITLFWVIALLPNSGWIIGNINAPGYTQATIQTIDQNHYHAFATLSWSLWIYQNTAMLQGFWREWVNPAIQTYQTSNRHWKNLVYFFALLIFLWILYRIFSPSKSHKGFDIAILLSSILAYILAIGVSGNPIIASISYFLYDHLPFYLGMREPQKWAGILLFGYVYFGGWGVIFITKQALISHWLRVSFLVCIMIAPICMMPTMAYFFNNTLKPTDFPTSWYTATQALHNSPIPQKISSFARDCTASFDQTNKCYDILVLPWHQYIRLFFTDRSVLNPAMSFFSEYRVLQGDNIEMGESIYSQSKKPESRYVEKYFWPEAQRTRIQDITSQDMTQFVNTLHSMGIYSVILLEPNRWNYENEFLKKWMSFGLIDRSFQDPSLEIYYLK